MRKRIFSIVSLVLILVLSFANLFSVQALTPYDPDSIKKEELTVINEVYEEKVNDEIKIQKADIAFSLEENSLPTDKEWSYEELAYDTPHDYPNRYNKEMHYSKAGAASVAVHFSKFETEKGYDYVYIKDKDKNVIATYDGTKEPFWAVVNGDTIYINLVSDAYVTGYGYQLDNFAYSTSEPSNNTEIGDKALEHIKYLSETIGPRVAGSEEEETAANYIKEKFERFGYRTTIQEFDISNNAEAKLKLLSPYDEKKEVIIISGSAYDSVTGILVDCKKGLSSEDFPTNVKGNVALIERGDAEFKVKAQNAVNAGATGVIIYNYEDEFINSPYMGTWESPIPVVFTKKSIGDDLLQKIEQSQVTANVSVAPASSQNIIAVKDPKGGNSNAEIIFITAHYDSVPGAPGANDNGSGTGMILALAEHFKDISTDKEIRFIACGAEEIGLNGSKYYVANLNQNEIDRSKGNFNLDMIATKYADCVNMALTTVDGRSNIITQAAMNAANAIGGDTYVVRKGGSSDHVPFHGEGIPAVCFIRQSTSGNLEPYYHKPQDTVAINISTVRLAKAGQIISKALEDALESTNIRMLDCKTPKVKKDVSEYYDLSLFIKDSTDK